MDQRCPSALDLVCFYLKEQLPYYMPVSTWHRMHDIEIMVSGVCIAELVDTTLNLIHPEKDLCIVVPLAHPDSLEMLRHNVFQYKLSRHWCKTMEANEKKNANREVTLDLVHRSSLGYKKEWK